MVQLSNTKGKTKPPYMFQNFNLVEEHFEGSQGINTKQKVPRSNPYRQKHSDVLPDDISPVRDQQTDAPDDDKLYIFN